MKSRRTTQTHTQKIKMIFFSVHFDNERLFGILLNFASNASFVLQTKYEVPLPVQCGFTNGDDFFFESG